MIDTKKLAELDMEVVNKPWSQKVQKEFSEFLKSRKKVKIQAGKARVLKPVRAK